MLGLLGDFSTMPLKDLVVYLGNKRATGTLKLERGDVKKEITLAGGLVVNTSSNQPREYLGQFLINTGYITEDQFTKAYETQKQTQVFLGKILVMIGLVSEETVVNTLSLKFRETLLEAFQWQDGTFAYEANRVAPRPEGMDLQIDLLDIHKEGEFRETAWKVLRGAFPSGNLRLEVVQQNLAENPKTGSLDAKLLKLIKEGHTIDGMVLALHATDFYLYQRLYALHRLGAVKVRHDTDEDVTVEVADANDTTGGATSEELLHRARMNLEKGEIREAEFQSRKAFELGPSDATIAMLRKAEDALIALLRKELAPPNQIPTISTASTKIKELTLSAPERYLLSRMDGSRTVAAIVHVSPLHELEALKMVERLIGKGLVKLKPQG